MAEEHKEGKDHPVISDPKQLCIHFANTVVWRASQRPEEVLTGADRLLRFTRFVGLIDEAELERLRAEIEANPTQAEQALERAKVVREAIYRVLFAVANRQEYDPADVAILNDAIEEAQGQVWLAPTGTGEKFEWRWKSEELQFDRLLWSAARSAAGLLTSDELNKLKSCPGEGCAYLFLDVSRNGKRRWCEMDLCGNRTKVKRFRQVHNVEGS